MAKTVEIPDFDFSAFYYPQIYEALVQYKRRVLEELTDESDYEPFNQLLKAFALVGHLNNVHLDIVANESTLPTSRLETTVRNMLQLIGYTLSSASPAQVDILYKLARVLTLTTELVPYRSVVGTKRVGDSAVIQFEADETLSCDRTDEFSAVLARRGLAYVDFTAEANDRTPGTSWSPWITAAIGDALYFGHEKAMWEELHAEILSACSGITGIWEYHDGTWLKSTPTSITDMGGTLLFDLTSYLGTSNKQGTVIRVYRNNTMTFEELSSTWDGSANVVQTTGYLGQTSPSLDPEDYTVGSNWEPVSDTVDGTSGLTVTGELSYTIPQNLTENWIAGEINGLNLFWLRFRILEVSTPVSPSLDWATMDAGNQYVVGQVTQGRTITEDPLGSSTGVPSQRFETARDYFLAGTMEITVNGTAWQQVENFLASQPADLHYTVEVGDNDRATVVFGDGVSGRVPPAGTNNIVATYRYGAEDDGNVGAGTVTVDKTGLSYISSVTNPRPAVGWKLGEGATAETLEQAKVNGPRTLRVRDVALGPDDVEALAVSYIDDSGASPFSRCHAFEEGFGPKTIEAAVVAAGGGIATAAQLAGLDTYFNGDKFSYPTVRKHLVANQEVTSTNHVPHLIDITATVYGDVEEESIRNHLSQVIQPEALKDDGVTWEWDWGGEVPVSRLSHEIFMADTDIKRVDISVPAADVPLEPHELPKLGTLTLTIIRSST